MRERQLSGICNSCRNGDNEDDCRPSQMQRKNRGQPSAVPDDMLTQGPSPETVRKFQTTRTGNILQPDRRLLPTLRFDRGCCRDRKSKDPVMVDPGTRPDRLGQPKSRRMHRPCDDSADRMFIPSPATPEGTGPACTPPPAAATQIPPRSRMTDPAAAHPRPRPRHNGLGTGTAPGRSRSGPSPAS